MDLRYTPEQIRAILREKGWSGRALAAHWHVSPVYLSRQINDQQRPPLWNDAFAGLPPYEELARAMERRQTSAEELIAQQPAARKRGPRPGTRRRAVDEVNEPVVAQQVGSGGYRYRGYLTTGSIVAALKALGEDVEEGCRGIVFAVEDLRVGERYGIIFESGTTDWFLPDQFDAYLAECCLEAPGLSGYAYSTERQLRSDFAAGLFEFWP
ncbi:hypothetical protein [Ralstonia sp. ASV6]|uniref:hypothetical protein n=1 Tax=Ralstonia sp. ASV6 TaxID=2795124 RepID=UPI0018EB4BE1|nr:hypothetical protein [Ralstonia sp. ASV6]